MTESTPTVRLKNGTDEVKPLVAIVMHSLHRLFDTGKGMVVYELASLCRNPDHKPFGSTGEELKSLELVSEANGKWYVHGSIRNIVLSAVQGEGLDMGIRSPLAPIEESGR